MGENGATEGICPQCGASSGPVLARGVARRCQQCFDARLRSLDADFLDNYARLGARSHIIVAEACLKALVLSDLADRKLLAATVYERFVAAATDLIGLYRALLHRRDAPIMEAVLGFRLQRETAADFFAALLRDGPAEVLHAIGLPHPDQLPRAGALLDKRETQQVRAALWDLLADFEHLSAYDEIGRQALASASRQLRGPVGLTETTGWLTEAPTDPLQVATLALDPEARRLEVNVVSIDEEVLGEVVDGIETLTRLVRNLVFAFVSLHPPSDFQSGFSDGPHGR